MICKYSLWEFQLHWHTVWQTNSLLCKQFKSRRHYFCGGYKWDFYNQDFKSSLPWGNTLLMAILIIFSMSSYDLVKSHNSELLFSTCYIEHVLTTVVSNLCVLSPWELNAVNIGSILCTNHLYDFWFWSFFLLSPAVCLLG